MKPVLIAGTIIVNLALVSYSIAVISEQRGHQVTPRVLRFLTAGVFFDITATICMIIGSSNSPFSLHGILGYSSLFAMTLDTFLIWRHWSRYKEGQVPDLLHLYSRYAYIWWVAAYVTGAVLVFMAR
ncbi:MAG: hypothetical protein NDJ18_07280 [candidate division Zixibacteria bacterium]|nr:hypothetical protein [candidate division Zixibacteria bacterium]